MTKNAPNQLDQLSEVAGGQQAVSMRDQLQRILPKQNPERPAESPIAAWLKAGRANPWIRQAYDPPFTEKSFCRCATREELRARMDHGNWCLGQAFYLDNLCFIQQVDGGDEWLALRGGVEFESVSLGLISKRGKFDDWLDRVAAATDEQLIDLEY
jgi:hypothetical protein